MNDWIDQLLCMYVFCCLRWDMGVYEVNFGQNIDFEIFVDSERKISSESNQRE